MDHAAKVDVMSTKDLVREPLVQLGHYTDLSTIASEGSSLDMQIRRSVGQSVIRRAAGRYLLLSYLRIRARVAHYRMRCRQNPGQALMAS